MAAARSRICQYSASARDSIRRRGLSRLIEAGSRNRSSACSARYPIGADNATRRGLYHGRHQRLFARRTDPRAPLQLSIPLVCRRPIVWIPIRGLEPLRSGFRLAGIPQANGTRCRRRILREDCVCFCCRSVRGAKDPESSTQLSVPEFARFVDKHHRDAVTNRVGEAR